MDEEVVMAGARFPADFFLEDFFCTGIFFAGAVFFFAAVFFFVGFPAGFLPVFFFAGAFPVPAFGEA
ncbi:MAG: hypothetical protein LBC18_10440 [Opitutaceae bacterium]|nr:hypothetical protein [Opitutaceae bacterium]